MKKYKVNEYLLYPNEDLTLDDEQLITRDNVQHLGELLALSAIKSILAKGRDIRYLYLGLLKNIHCPASCEQTIPDGYDIAQNSISYLCEHIGKRLGDTIISRYGKPISVRIGCLRNNGCYINNTYARPHDRYTCFDDYKNILTCDIEERVSYAGDNKPPQQATRNRGGNKGRKRKRRTSRNYYAEKKLQRG